MSKRVVTLYGKEYNVNCDAGQEDRLAEIVRFVEERMEKVAGGVGNTTEARLLMLTCLHLADELLDGRRKSEEALQETQQKMEEALRQVNDAALENEELFVAAVEHLQGRVAHIASQVGSA
jgi:cell division protein ZapA